MKESAIQAKTWVADFFVLLQTNKLLWVGRTFQSQYHWLCHRLCFDDGFGCSDGVSFLKGLTLVFKLEFPFRNEY